MNFNGYCERCGKKTNTFKCSWFNTQNICPECQEKESKHPLFKEAKRVENEEVLKGNLNFEGIGLPKDLM